MLKNNMRILVNRFMKQKSRLHKYVRIIPFKMQIGQLNVKVDDE